MKIYSKLFNLQGRLKVGKDGRNPHFKSSYVTLDNLLSVLLPMLEEEKLVAVHYLEDNHLITEVKDIESGESIKSSFHITQEDPQKIGSAVSYGKRYSLGAIFNIITDVDDDGNSASTGYTSTGKKVIEHRHPRTDMTIMDYVTAIGKEKDSNALRNIFTEALEVEMTESQREMLISAKDVRKKYLAENEGNPFIK